MDKVRNKTEYKNVICKEVYNLSFPGLFCNCLLSVTFSGGFIIELYYAKRLTVWDEGPHTVPSLMSVWS